MIDSIKHLKNGKSAGVDKILGELLKNANNIVVDFLVTLFNALFENGTFPTEWSKSIIVPIHKKGDINNPDNYRGVALTSVVSKVYTHILNKRLSRWAEREEKIIEEQAGFRAGYSTIDHIFTLYTLVQKYLLNSTKLYVAFVDFKKAFDSVNRNRLWESLRKNGVNGKLYLALRGMYDSVLACVREKSIYSEYFNCPRGVKQGCLLSPQMFSFFINELAVELSKKGRHGIQIIPGAVEIFLMLFADDIILLSDTILGLQAQLNALKEEADRLQLVVNLDKTNIMVFRMGGYLSFREKWWYGNEAIKVTNCYKYLGMVFTTRLSLNVGMREVCRKGKKGIIEILKCLRNLNSLDVTLFWKLFDAQIVPMIAYGSEIWGLMENEHIERVHTYAIKKLINVPIHSSNQIVYGETGRYPLFIIMHVRCIRYWVKLTQLPQSRLAKQAYLMTLQELEKGKKNWACRVKNVLMQYGFGFVWLCQGVGNEKMFLSEFKDRLVCCFKQNWHAKLNSDDKYEWYFSFKSVFEPEKYLMIVTNKWHRDMLARFRTRTLGLQANPKWFTENRAVHGCPTCGDSSVSEDEYHLLFDCKSYESIRNDYMLFRLPEALNSNLVSIVSSDSDHVITQLAEFIAKAVKIRTIMLEK